MAKRRTEELAIGEDAFLDTVANLVGILIILVVIVSAGTKSAADLISSQRITENTQAIETPLESAKQIELDLMRQVDQANHHEFEIAYRKAERDTLLQKVLVAKETVEETTSELDQTKQMEIEFQVAMSEMEKELARILMEKGEVESKEKPTVVLQHLPTPMAKTVFGKEMHLMIRNNLITVVPWDRLVATLKSEVQARLSRGIKKDRIVNQLSPIDGFVMEYILVTKRGFVSNGATAAMAQMIELEKFELDATPEIVQETLDAAFAPSGRMRLELTRYIPRETTITAWVYPDSFETFRQMKEKLFVEGYMTAARPLPEGLRIGASPRGSQSTAQ
jgi:hypothetical protein